MPAGRPSKFSPMALQMFKWLARDGLTQTEICKRMGIGEKTFDRWVVKHPEIRQALQDGRIVPDYTVEDALIRRCLGWEYEEVTTVEKEVFHPVSGERQVMHETRRMKKAVLPDTTAIIYWLKNRNPRKWLLGIDQVPPDSIRGNVLPAGLDTSRLSDEEAIQLFNTLRKMSLPPPSERLQAFAAAPPVPTPVEVESVPLPRVPPRKRGV